MTRFKNLDDDKIRVLCGGAMCVRVSGSAVCDVFVYLIMCVVYNLLLYRSEY